MMTTVTVRRPVTGEAQSEEDKVTTSNTVTLQARAIETALLFVRLVSHALPLRLWPTCLVFLPPAFLSLAISPPLLSVHLFIIQTRVITTSSVLAYLLHLQIPRSPSRAAERP
jgi:hypothetical protein